jgi:hypothetical protein
MYQIFTGRILDLVTVFVLAGSTVLWGLTRNFCHPIANFSVKADREKNIFRSITLLFLCTAVGSYTNCSLMIILYFILKPGLILKLIFDSFYSAQEKSFSWRESNWGVNERRAFWTDPFCLQVSRILTWSATTGRSPGSGATSSSSLSTSHLVGGRSRNAVSPILSRPRPSFVRMNI